MARTTSSLRYAVLRHEGAGAAHYDLMFESAPGGDLVTFQSDVWPVDARTKVRRLAEHRRAYLDYEGPVSGQRGYVRRVEGGALASPVVWTEARITLTLQPSGKRLLLWRQGDEYYLTPADPAQNPG